MREGASLVAQAVKSHLQCSLGGEDPLEKGMATYSSILAWRIPWTKDPGRVQSWGCKEKQNNLSTLYKINS